MKVTVYLLLAALSVSAGGTLREARGNVTVSTGNLTARLLKARNFQFNLNGTRDGKSFGVLIGAQIWYHGRSGNTRHFYQDQAEPSWPLKRHEIKDGTVTAHTGNVDFDVARRVTVYPDTDAVRLDYELTVRESRDFNRDRFPLMSFTKEVTSVSFDDGKLGKFVTKAQPSAADLIHSRAFLLHIPSRNSTLLLLADVNAPLALGERAGLAALYRNSGWCKSMSFTHLGHRTMPYLKKGEKLGASFGFALLGGGAYTPAQAEAARALAKRFGWTAARVDGRLFDHEYRQSSKLAGRLAALPGLTLWTESPMKHVYPGTAAPEAKLPGIVLESAANEYESAQLVLTPSAKGRLTGIHFSDLSGTGGAKIPSGEFRAYLLGYETVAHARALFGGENRLADKMIPLHRALPLSFDARSGNVVLHLTFRAPKGARGGTYRGTVSLTFADGRRAAVPVTLKVWDFELPAKRSYTAYGLLWNVPQNLRLATLKRLSACGFAGSTNAGGQANLRKAFDGKELRLSDDLETARRAVREYGMSVWQAPYMFLGAWDWRPGKKVQFLGSDPEKPEFEKNFKAYFRSLYRQAAAKGIQKECIAYMWDEVTAPHYPLMRRTTAWVRETAPGIKVMTVGAPDPEVVAVNDIITTGGFPLWWGPEAAAIIAAGRKAGKEFWVYLNGETFATDGEAVIPRLTAWRSYARGLSGYLQWSMDYRWNDSFASRGDVRLLYPPEGGEPVTSVRLERFRDGVEDYEYLRLSEKLPPAERTRLRRMIDRLAPAYGETSTDIVRLRDVRRALGEALSRGGAPR